MKKSLPLILAVICTVLICFSCKQKQEVEKKSNLTPLKELNTVDRATYNSWVDGWKAKGKGYNDTSLIEYFTMPVVDLTEFGRHPSSTARFVLGMDTTVYPMEPHLMLVSTDSNKVAILPPAANVYDLSKPCPRVCHPPRN